MEKNSKIRTLTLSKAVLFAIALVAALALDSRGGGSRGKYAPGFPCARAASSLCTSGAIVDAIAKELKAANYKPDEIASALWGIAEMFKIIGYNRHDVLGRVVFKNKKAITKGVPKVLHPKLDKNIKYKILNEKKTNLDLMKAGNAPVGPDGLQVNLHHTIGLEPGPMIEVVATVHQKHTKILHGYIEASFRNTPTLEASYKSYRKKYWKQRAMDFASN